MAYSSLDYYHTGIPIPTYRPGDFPSGMTDPADGRLHVIRVRMGGDRFEIPRRSVRSASRSEDMLRGTTGVHLHKKGQLLVNGSADGLVEVIINPPFHTGRTLSTMFVKERVNSLLVSLADPDGFIAAAESRSAG